MLLVTFVGIAQFLLHFFFPADHESLDVSEKKKREMETIRLTSLLRTTFSEQLGYHLAKDKGDKPKR